MWREGLRAVVPNGYLAGIVDNVEEILNMPLMLALEIGLPCRKRKK